MFLLLFLITTVVCQRDGDIQLMGGSYQWEGRVEIFLSGDWGTITDSIWTVSDAEVVCRKLGHFKPGARAFPDAYFGEGSGAVNLDFVQCSGSEYNLTDCETSNSGSRSSHALDVGVKCEPMDGSYREGDVRLVGGAHNWEGRVEIFLSWTWRALTDSEWTDYDASVVCRQLKYPALNAFAGHCCRIQEEEVSLKHSHCVECAGTETNITQCPKSVNVSNEMDVSVHCTPGSEVYEGSIRLVGGGYMWQGRVEIFSSGAWNSVTFNQRLYYGAALVACRQLGYNSNGAQSYCCSKYGQGTGPILSAIPVCSRQLYRLSDCHQLLNNGGIFHSEDWSINCQIGGPEPGDVRNIRYINYNGNLEIFLQGKWQYIASTARTWSQRNSKVACKQMGRSTTGTSFMFGNGLFTPEMAHVVDNVNCTGKESKITDCPHIIKNSLQPYKAIILNCPRDERSSEDMRLVGGESEREGRVEIWNLNTWQTVCGRHWSSSNTAVVCRYLGFNDDIDDSMHYLSDVFGRGYGPNPVDVVNCSGSETRIMPYRPFRCSSPSYINEGCSTLTHRYGCSHDDDVGVRCQPASCSDGQLRLTGGVDDRSGCVQICYNQRWGTFFGGSPYWSIYNARVACNELGFESYSDWNEAFRQFKSHWFITYFNCSGTEHRLSHCPNISHDINLSYDSEVGVICSYAHCHDGESRLMEGEKEWEGRLEVCLNKRWGTVKEQGWSTNNTQIVCIDLGYSSTGHELYSVPQSPSKPVFMTNVVCTSGALTLLDCDYTLYVSDTNNITDVGLSCNQSFCINGDVRVEGRRDTEGKLEMCIDSRWTIVSGTGWTKNNTKVACAQLGYTTSEQPHSVVPHGSSKPVKITRVSCSGSEKRLIDCTHQPYHGPQYTAEDVIITCIINSSPTVSTTTNVYNTSVPSTPHATVAVEKDVSTHDDSSPSVIYIAATTVPTVLVSCGGLVATICAILCYRKRRMKSSKAGKGISTGGNMSYLGITILADANREATTPGQTGDTSAGNRGPVYSEIPTFKEGPVMLHQKRLTSPIADEHIYGNVVKVC